jgi:uncharacterized protein
VLDRQVSRRVQRFDGGVATGCARRDTELMTVLLGPSSSDGGAPAGARSRADEPVTVLYSRRVKPGREADFEAWARGILAAARQFPGDVGASVLDAPGSRERHILFSFDDPKSLRAWLDSDERRRWLARVEELLEADRGLQQLTGLETWFKLTGLETWFKLTGLETWFKLPGSNVPTMKPPPRWKMWLVSLVAVYPLVLAFQALLVPRMVRLPLPLRALLFPAGAADADDLCGHAGGDPGAPPLAWPTTRRRTARGQAVATSRRR